MTVERIPPPMEPRQLGIAQAISRAFPVEHNDDEAKAERKLARRCFQQAFTLDPRERHKLGAHYTPRAYVERLVLPTVVEPLRADWAHAQAAALLVPIASGEHEPDEARFLDLILSGDAVLGEITLAARFLPADPPIPRARPLEVVRRLDPLGVALFVAALVALPPVPPEGAPPTPRRAVAMPPPRGAAPPPVP